MDKQEISDLITSCCDEGGISSAGVIAIAVSGGADSMALAHCMKEWNRKARLVGIIVDHKLRAESSEEAKTVAGRLEHMGIEARVLELKHDGITARVHETAREGRYELLIEECKKLGASHLFIAHHADDNAETVLMRIAKGSGTKGLAGIPKITMRKGIKFIRPLLEVSKDRLIQVCKEAGVEYVTDPSNEKEKYARGRLRKLKPLLEKEGLTKESLLKLASRAREDSEALEKITGYFLSENAVLKLSGTIDIKRKGLQEAPLAIAVRAISRGLRTVHFSEYPPRHDSVMKLYDDVMRETEEAIVKTLNECLIVISKKWVKIIREASLIKEKIPAAGNTEILWDNRWLVKIGDVPIEKGAFITKLDNPKKKIVKELCPNLFKQVPHGRERASLPVIRTDEKILYIPSFDCKDAVSMRFVSDFGEGVGYGTSV
ncbi:MAG: tRNA lysidine(34) synthetase TilS [Alphaproteobacteria bacterium]|nr:tRNA lysidine(34) synthetase TilS [Alphaproteobacteria bacterium]MCL2504682.1 tRNA lysidine(34) synthetase TilS [Alphaproteobacteria bacterium]